MKLRAGFFYLCAQGAASAFSPGHVGAARNSILGMVSTVPGSGSMAVDTPEEVRVNDRLSAK